MNRFMLRRLTWLDARATHLEEAGQRQEAAALREQHCQELARQLGPGHPAHLEGLQRLAKCHCSAGRPEDAEKVYRLATDHVKGVIEQTPSLDPETAALGAQLLNDLGVLLCSQQRPREALAPFRRALELSSSHLSPASPALPRVHSNLGNSLHSLGRYEAARVQYEKALDLLQRLPPSTDLVHCLTDLTECLIELDDLNTFTALEEAIDRARALPIGEASEIARALIRLANLAERTQRRSMAIALLEEAAEIIKGEPRHANLLAKSLGLLRLLQRPC